MNVFRAALSRDFWITGIAIARYIPRAFRTKQIDGNLFFTEEKRKEYRRRVESLKQDSLRRWGTMEVGQMLHHLNLACGGSPGFYDLADEKAQLLKILEADWNARTADQWKPHPMFGTMSPTQWGKLLQIHLDYHLRQFSA